jgi:hypothetical protein
MQFIIQGIIVALKNPQFRATLIESSREIIKKFGLGATKNFFKNIPAEQLRNLTKQEIIALAEAQLKKSATTGINDAVFSRSNARNLASVFNKSIDYIENKTKTGIIKAYASITNRKLADTLKTLSSPGSASAGKEGIDVLGIEVGGKFIGGRSRSKAYNRARDIALESLRLTVVPKNKKEAFAVAYVRGFLGEATGTAATSILVAAPRSIIAAPQARTFYRILQNEVEFLRTSGQVRSASQLSKALKNATAGARDVYGSQKGLINTQIAGYASGRLTIPIASTYVFVDKDERKKRVNKLQSSVAPYAKKQIKIYVDSYTRTDGTKVKGHYRQAEVVR